MRGTEVSGPPLAAMVFLELFSQWIGSLNSNHYENTIDSRYQLHYYARRNMGAIHQTALKPL